MTNPEADSTATPPTESERSPDAVPSSSTASGEAHADPGAATASRAPRPRGLGLGLALTLLGSIGGFVLMSADAQFPFSVLVGAIAMAVATAGVLELCGLLRSASSDLPLGPRLFDALPGEPSWRAPRVTVPAAIAVVAIARLALGPAGLALPLLVAHLLLLVSSLRRPALFAGVVSSLLLLPMLGDYGLWDPWETHYGEVAREILARDDWITLWWAQDEWFRSKPVFIFWIEAFAWGALGIPFGADANPGHPEWAIRLPHYLLSMGALMSSYALVARMFTRRAGVIATLVLATTPYFYLLSHQAITDMPFVATMTIALALFGLAVESAGEGSAVKQYRVGPLMFSAQNIVIAAFVLTALPQVLYLMSRNLTFVTHELGFWLHKDEFLFGSADNSAIPGNPIHRMRGPYLKALWYQPAAQGLLWLIGLVLLLRTLKKTRDPATLGMFGFYLFCSYAWMAKGIPGFGLPALIAALYLFATQRLPLLTAGKLRVGMGILTIVVTGFPWYVAMYGRLGPFFTDRLLIHDHINRLASGVHGDTGPIDYFLTQLGYGMFPWFGLAPLGLVAARILRGGAAREGGHLPEPGTPLHEAATRQRRTLVLLALWMIASFALFNAMITKFHHYIFPAVPPLALLIGLVVDKLLGDEVEDRASARWAIVLSGLAAIPLAVGAGGLYGNVRGVIPEDVDATQYATWSAGHGLHPILATAAILLGIGLVIEAARRLGSLRDPASRASPASAGLGAALIGGALLTAFAGRDLAYVTHTRPEGKERLIDLFVYNYDRPFPEHLDYHAALAGFAVAAFVITVLAAVAPLRKASVYALLGLSFWFSVWSLDVYLIDLSPHWGQRELVKRYYEQRRSKDEPLIAWQMNWKGENLYTGNRVYVYADLDTKDVEKWMSEHKGTQAYFLLEHSRMSNFKRMLGARKVEPLSTARENNKFVLVRASL